MLFEEKKRTRQEPLRPGENLYEFYDQCARKGYKEVRSILNGWLDEMPPDDGAELANRMRKRGDSNFRHGFCELIVHALLVRLTSQVEVHPQVKGTRKRPDFSAIHAGDARRTYVEVTTINPSDERIAEGNRENGLYNAIDECNLPAGCMLGYELVRAGKGSPSMQKVVLEIETWAATKVAAAQNEVFSRRFSVDDWDFELELIPTTNSEPVERAIGMVHIGGEWITPNFDLRTTCESKSYRYGRLDSPYLIAVSDCTDQLWGASQIFRHAAEALFGDEVVEISHSGKTQHTRNPNGFWIGANGPRNRNVSAVMILPPPVLWTFRSDPHPPLLAINPWAEHTLPEQFDRLPRMIVENDKPVLNDGEQIADILGLPDPWPPNEGTNVA